MPLTGLLLSFKGRATRSQFWIVSIASNAVLAIASVIFGGRPLLAILLLPLAIAYFWVAIAVQVKRWHDRGKSGWWSLICLVPVIGTAWVLVECGCLPGTVGPNAFGPDPLAGAGSARVPNPGRRCHTRVAGSQSNDSPGA